MNSTIGEYQIIERITENQVYETYLCRNHKGRPFSIKHIPVGNQEEGQLMKKEAGLFLFIDHPNIVKTKQCFFTQKQEYFNIAYEHCQGSALSQSIGLLSKEKIKQVMLTISKSVKFLHCEQNIVHKNLKPQSIFLNGSEIKIVDFGLTLLTEKIKDAQNPIQTFYFTKELLLMNQFGKEMDIWALGIIFLELLAGKRIFHIVEEDLPPCMRTHFPENVIAFVEEEEMKKLIRGMLDKVESRRFTIQEIIKYLLEVEGENKKEEKKKQEEKKSEEIKQHAKLISDASASAGGLEKKQFVYDDGRKYQGTWLDNKKEGFGIMKWPDGASYEGEWKNDEAHGKGRLQHADGDIYEGDWMNDKANGFGTYLHSNGNQYKGQWKEDLQNGEGIEIWTDGSSYKGQYLKGVKNGYGLYQWADGSTYEGEWKNNKINGKGQYKWADKRSYNGEWCENKMHGHGVFTWTDGRKFQGEYVHDKKEGFGIFYWNDGRRYEGQWKNGKQHGNGTYYSNNGRIRTGIWQDGKIIQENQSIERRD